MVEENRNLEQVRTDSIKSQVQAWLMEEGWSVGAAPANPDAEWIITGVNSAGTRIQVAQKTNTDQITIGGTITLDDTLIEALSRVDESTRSDSIWDLKMILLSMSLEFQGLDDKPQRISVGQRIYLEALRKDLFVQRVLTVRNGLLAVMWSVMKIAGSTSERGQVGFRPQRDDEES